MEGMPCKVSVVVRTNCTKRFPRFAYSTKYIADPTPTGTEMSSASAAMCSVFTSAGISYTLSEVYSHSNRLGVR